MFSSSLNSGSGSGAEPVRPLFENTISVVVGAAGGWFSMFMLTNGYMKYYFNYPDNKRFRRVISGVIALFGVPIGGALGGEAYVAIFPSEKLTAAEQWVAGLLGAASPFVLELLIGFCVHKTLGVERERFSRI